ncbi:DUF4320 family protein [Desulfosporosinus lacus]|uniref:DUF4320 family protein n=1 Tax=Desulfosporosinus lacus DSM 15449 TaxID=1121420 RepID=A0A1M5V2Q5_9FIRM|nr:DUF4320 family protein [Desulfosporosinus lacus]SHH69557.1 protein of unknown function [Desulfosporosinus lacus DSM 15449]
MLKLLRQKRGEGYIDVAVIVLAAMLCIALVVRIAPVFIVKNQLDTFASELVREAEIAGQVGSETNSRAHELQNQLGITPTISWSQTGRLQLDTGVTVTCAMTMNIGLFGGFGSFPIELTAKASGKSEVYWK